VLCSLSLLPVLSSSWLLDRRLCCFRRLDGEGTQIGFVQHRRKPPFTSFGPGSRNKYWSSALRSSSFSSSSSSTFSSLFIITLLLLLLHWNCFITVVLLIIFYSFSSTLPTTYLSHLNLDLPRSCVCRSSLSTLPFFSSRLGSLWLMTTRSRDVYVLRKLDGGSFVSDATSPISLS